MFVTEDEDISGTIDYSEDHLETMAKEIQTMKAAREERDKKLAEEKAIREKLSNEQESDQNKTISRK